ncbi:MAG: hypothetical protein H6831_02640 [Planctomycetes bacterium]|nr:hypothetical protein [Planctomycetota bacterium]MCB9903281.1 hypothetical protein [Planctomycetota bacterium]
MKTLITRWSAALLISALSTLALAGAVHASQEKGADEQKPAVQTEEAKKAADDAVIAAQLPFYPLTTCPISGEELGDDAVNTVVDGNLYRTCCKKCAAKIAADPSSARAKIERAVVAQQKPLWPLTSCPISGNEVAEGGKMEPYDMVYGMRYYRLCCEDCKSGFLKNPDRVTQAVDKAWIAEQTKTYPLTTCPISGEELGSMGQPIDRLYGPTLVRLCCKGCVKSFDKDPAKYAKQVRDARIDRRRGKEAKEAGAPK